MTISIISAISKNFAIGKDNKLLYHLAKDLKHFKELTSGHTVIMGKNTFESLPKRPLPNRRNIVLAFPDETPKDKQGAEWVSSIDEALKLAENDGEVFIIGGAFVYNQFIPLANKLYLTVVDDTPKDADAFFPIINLALWDIVSEESHTADEKNEKDFKFMTLKKK